MYKDEKGRSLTEASHSMVAAFFMSGKQDYLKMLREGGGKSNQKIQDSNLLMILSLPPYEIEGHQAAARYLSVL